MTLIEQGENSNLLNRKIFFSVYGNAKSQFKFDFEYEYKTLFNEKLLSATQLGDGQVLPQVLVNEEDEGFYSFQPWWSKSENRTVVFLADMIFNKVFFYAQWNDYPKHYLTSLHDKDDIICVCVTTIHMF